MSRYTTTNKAQIGGAQGRAVPTTPGPGKERMEQPESERPNRHALEDREIEEAAQSALELGELAMKLSDGANFLGETYHAIIKRLEELDPDTVDRVGPLTERLTTTMGEIQDVLEDRAESMNNRAFQASSIVITSHEQRLLQALKEQGDKFEKHISDLYTLLQDHINETAAKDVEPIQVPEVKSVEEFDTPETVEAKMGQAKDVVDRLKKMVQTEPEVEPEVIETKVEEPKVEEPKVEIGNYPELDPAETVKLANDTFSGLFGPAEPETPETPATPSTPRFKDGPLNSKGEPYVKDGRRFNRPVVSGAAVKKVFSEKTVVRARKAFAKAKPKDRYGLVKKLWREFGNHASYEAFNQMLQGRSYKHLPKWESYAKEGERGPVRGSKAYRSNSEQERKNV